MSIWKTLGPKTICWISWDGAPGVALHSKEWRNPRISSFSFRLLGGGDCRVNFAGAPLGQILSRVVKIDGILKV